MMLRASLHVIMDIGEVEVFHMIDHQEIERQDVSRGSRPGMMPSKMHLCFFRGVGKVGIG